LAYNILYKESVKKDLQKIDKKEVGKILDALESALTQNPTKGKRLTGNYKGLYSYRLRNYRVVYTILRESVLVLRIGHRKDVYK